MKPRPMSLDIISTLPSSVIEIILCFLSIKEAARTSILSKEWRYKWTKIPKLEFDDYMFKESNDVANQLYVLEMGKRFKLFYVIYQVLLMQQGPIYEFSLSSDVDRTFVEIDHIIRYLSRNNTIKELRLRLFEEEGEKYVLPLSVFSWHHLTVLHLRACDINLPPTFNGFGCLESLYLHHVSISTKTLRHLLSNCPLLKRFTVLIFEDDFVDDVDSTVVELFECLPAIEQMYTWSCSTGCFILDSVPQELPTSLVRLKYFAMDLLSFADKDVLPFLALLIRCSPNLEKIRLELSRENDNHKVDSAILKKYSDIWLENLSDLQIYGFANLKFDLELVKLILAKSPKLKKVLLWFHYALDKKKESKILRFLLRSPPASPAVEIIIKTCLQLQMNLEYLRDQSNW